MINFIGKAKWEMFNIYGLDFYFLFNYNTVLPYDHYSSEF